MRLGRGDDGADIGIGFDAGQRLMPVGEGAHLVMARRKHLADKIGRRAAGLNQNDAHDFIS